MTTQQRYNTITSIILLLMLMLPIFCALGMAIDLEGSFVKKAAYLGVVLVLLAIPALFLKARTYFIVEGIFNFLFFPIDIASLYLNRQSTSQAFLHNIFATDIAEATELLSGYWLWGVGYLLLVISYFVLACRLENKRLFGKTATKVVAGITIAFALSVIVAGSVYGWIVVWLKAYKIYPYNLYIHTAHIIHDYREQTQLSRQVETFTFGISPAVENGTPIYVLVIGEAARYDHLGLNGYYRNTTPRLSTLNPSNLLSFDSAYSQANLTANAVPLLYTRATATNPNLAYMEKTLPEAFQEAGYKTGWLSKQEPVKTEQRAMSAMDYTYCWNKGIDVVDNYDIDLVSKLHTFVEDTAQFFVLHTMGCHYRYEWRYPPEFERFQPVFGMTYSYALINEANKDKLINAYDNAILYTDYFLSELIACLDSLDRPAAMLYISDHGESFWDDDRKLSFHGSYTVSDAEYHVPLLLWLSDEYCEHNKDKATHLQHNTHKCVSSQVVFYTLLDIAGISLPAIPSLSLCSPEIVSQDTICVITGEGKTATLRP